MTREKTFTNHVNELWDNADFHMEWEAGENWENDGPQWINGKAVFADGREIPVGGGWVENGEVTDPYGPSEAGDLDEFMEALGIPACREDHSIQTPDYDWLTARDIILELLAKETPSDESDDDWPGR